MGTGKNGLARVKTSVSLSAEAVKMLAGMAAKRETGASAVIEALIREENAREWDRRRKHEEDMG
jgi:hypothetical protein